MNYTQSLEEDALALCHQIEKCGASAELTQASIMASALFRRIADTEPIEELLEFKKLITGGKYMLSTHEGEDFALIEWREFEAEEGLCLCEHQPEPLNPQRELTLREQKIINEAWNEYASVTTPTGSPYGCVINDPNCNGADECQYRESSPEQTKQNP